MSPNEFDKLVESIRSVGVQQPILTYQGQILDGRHRAEACDKLGLPYPTEEYEGPDDVGTLLQVVAGLNLHRRHLTQSQLAAIALEALPRFEEEARERQQEGRLQGAKVTKGEASASEYAQAPRRASAEAGKALGVSASSVEKAKRVQKSAPELLDPIKRGDMTLNAAAKQIPKPTDPKPTVMVDTVVREAGELRCQWATGGVLVPLRLPMSAEAVADRLEELARKLRKARGSVDARPIRKSDATPEASLLAAFPPPLPLPPRLRS